jgi:hypothetical protein
MTILARKPNVNRWRAKGKIWRAREQNHGAQRLTLAYRSAGLPWAARASCICALASIVIEGEEDGELPVTDGLALEHREQLLHTPICFLVW